MDALDFINTINPWMLIIFIWLYIGVNFAVYGVAAIIKRALLAFLDSKEQQ